MSKRAHAESSEEAGTPEGVAAPKRQKRAPQERADALALLEEHFKALRTCLKKIRKGSESSEESQERLTSLSKTLLPAFRTLSGSEETDNTNTNTPPAHAPAPAPAHAPAPAPTPAHGKSTPNYGNILPILGNMTQWTPEDIPDKHPPLPPIPDQDLERMALTHHGMRRNDKELSYETLEFLGDAFIYHLASELITQTFPRLKPGRQSQMREGLLRNSNLALYTLHYGLDKRAKIPLEFVGDGRPNGSKATNKERQKVNGDLFEAYVGALIRARPPAGVADNYDGVEVATRWLKPLWATVLAKDIRSEYRTREDLEQQATRLPLPKPSGASNNTRNGSNVSNGDENTNPDTNAAVDPAMASSGSGHGQVVPKLLTAKVRLGNLIGCPGVMIRYEEAPGKVKLDKYTKLPLYTAAVWVDAWGLSECLGYGSALSKAEAANKAAENAMENQKQMKFYVGKKTALAEAQRRSAQNVLQ